MAEKKTRAKKEKSAEEKAADASAKAGKLKVEVETLFREALGKLATSSGSGVKLQSGKDDSNGLFPSGAAGAVKEAVRIAKAGEDPRIQRVVSDGGQEVFGLTPAGVESVAESLPPAEAAKLIDGFTARHADALPHLLPVRERVKTKLVQQMKEQEERQAEQEAQRNRVLDALERQRRLLLDEREQLAASLQRQLTQLGVSPAGSGSEPQPIQPPPDDAELNRLNDEIARLKGELRAAKAAASDQTNIAPEDSQEFVRNVARRIVSAWVEAADKGMDQARNALEVVLGNVAAIEPIGEEGETTEFDPGVHECVAAIAPGTTVSVQRPGWLLNERAGVEYVVKKALVRREA